MTVRGSCPGIRPQFHTFTADVPPWDRLPDDGLPRYPSTKADSESAM
jgi:hypothetical protein